MRKTLAGGLLLGLLAGPALADVTVEQETKMSGLMKIATLGRSMKTVTQVSGDKMRSDSSGQVQIIDVEAEKIVDIDTKKKTYSVMTFEEMKKRMEAALAKAKQSAKEKDPEAGSLQTSAEIKVSETGKSQTISGYPCNQFLMETTLTVKDKEKGEEGELSSLMELWLTQGAPGVEEMNAFYGKMAQKLGTTAIAREWLSAQEQENEFSVSMNQMVSETRKLDGFAVRSVFYFGTLEAAKQEALSGETEKKKGGGFGGLLKKMTPVPGAQGESEESQEGSPQGGVIMKMTTETKKIDTKPVNPSLFTVPEGYKQVEPDKE